MILLSICIPSFNRSDLVLRLVGYLISVPGNFEICVHVDGSTDNTIEQLKLINDPRLRMGYAPNQGRAGALYSAVQMARGQFVMLFDDDDTLWSEGIDIVLRDCAASVPDGCVGFVYHLADDNGKQVGDDFPCDRTNLLALRADLGVRGDKKEVVLTESLKKVMMDGADGHRRIPTSLFWSRLALDHDVICRNQVIGRKTYLAGGMTHGIRSLKTANAIPMVLLYFTHLRGFLLGKYRSPRFAMRSMLALALYSGLSIWAYFRNLVGLNNCKRRTG